jgi:AcrR family transcriptional regulator
MPKVTDEHKVRRRQQILDAARECFVRKGFHQTSMADVFEASGLSSGAVYGYFRSKDEIIAAIANEVLTRVDRIVSPAFNSDPVPTLNGLMRQMLETAEGIGFDDNEFARLAPQVWAEASRNATLGDPVRVEYRRLRGSMADVIQRQQNAGMISPEVSPEKVAMVVFGALLGYIVQKLVLGDIDPESYAQGLADLIGASR